MDRVTAGMATAVGRAAGKPPADSHLAETVVGSRHLAEMVVGVVDGVADRHKVAYLMRVNSHHHTVYRPYPGWGIGFVEWGHPAPGLDIDT